VSQGSVALAKVEKLIDFVWGLNKRIELLEEKERLCASPQKGDTTEAKVVKVTTIHEYTEFVRELFAKKNEAADGFMHAAAGNSGEAGEIMDMIKKHWVYGKPIDREKLIEEMGDQLWYFFALMQLVETDLWAVIDANVKKLRKRYPQGYTDTAAIARRDTMGARP